MNPDSLPEPELNPNTPKTRKNLGLTLFLCTFLGLILVSCTGTLSLCYCLWILRFVCQLLVQSSESSYDFWKQHWNVWSVDELFKLCRVRRLFCRELHVICKIQCSWCCVEFVSWYCFGNRLISKICIIGRIIMNFWLDRVWHHNILSQKRFHFFIFCFKRLPILKHESCGLVHQEVIY